MKATDIPEYDKSERCYPEYGGGLSTMHFARYEYVKNFLKNKRILDFGCGEGYGTAILRKVGKFVVGSDYDKEVLSRAKEKYGPDINLVASDCLQSCFKDNVFDAVVSFEVIEHVKDIDAYLYAIWKMVKDDGVFYLSTPNRSVQEKFVRKTKQKKYSFHLRELNERELKKYLKRYFKKIQLLGQMRGIKSHLYNFIKTLDWFNLRHIILSGRIRTKLMQNFYRGDNDRNITTGDFVITSRIIRQAAILIAICKMPKRDLYQSRQKITRNNAKKHLIYP